MTILMVTQGVHITGASRVEDSFALKISRVLLPDFSVPLLAIRSFAAL
jgi:hypothetical protein